MIPTTTQINPKYWAGRILFLTVPNHPNLSIAKLLARSPHILVTNKIPIPVLEAKNAKPVTKVPPMIPPSQDHHGLSSENICGI